MKLALPAAVLAVCLLPLGAQNAAPSAPETPATPANLAETANPPAVLPQPAETNPVAHTALTGDVMEALTSAPALASTPITISVTDQGAVSLNGVVTSQSEADAAVAAVKAVPGVKSVTSEILVNKDPFAPAAAAATPAAPKGTNPLVDTSNDPQAKLDTALNAHPDLALVASNVYANEATLFGTVTSSKAKSEAEQIARQTLPNFKISNIIFVNSRPSGPAPLVPKQ